MISLCLHLCFCLQRNQIIVDVSLACAISFKQSDLCLNSSGRHKKGNRNIFYMEYDSLVLSYRAKHFIFRNITLMIHLGYRTKSKGHMQITTNT